MLRQNFSLLDDKLHALSPFIRSPRQLPHRRTKSQLPPARTAAATQATSRLITSSPVQPETEPLPAPPAHCSRRQTTKSAVFTDRTIASGSDAHFDADLSTRPRRRPARDPRLNSNTTRFETDTNRSERIYYYPRMINNSRGSMCMARPTESLINRLRRRADGGPIITDQGVCNPQTKICGRALTAEMDRWKLTAEKCCIF